MTKVREGLPYKGQVNRISHHLAEQAQGTSNYIHTVNQEEQRKKEYSVIPGKEKEREESIWGGIWGRRLFW